MTAKKIKGSCLCGNLSYKIATKSGEIYQCHCSKCRKLSGSSSNANIIISMDNFVWMKEPQSLRIFRTQDGWESPFCSTCGSVAPLYDDRDNVFYVPAGSLEDDSILTVTEHKHLTSKASWEV